MIGERAPAVVFRAVHQPSLHGIEINIGQTVDPGGRPRGNSAESGSESRRLRTPPRDAYGRADGNGSPSSKSPPPLNRCQQAILAVQLGQKIYVLHAFQKKSKTGVKTPKRDVDVIRQRYKEAQELAKHDHEEKES